MSFEQIQREAKAAWEAFTGDNQARVLVGAGTCGRAAGAQETMDALRFSLADGGVDASIHEVGCLGLCYAEPLVELRGPGAPALLCSGVTADVAPGLVESYFVKGETPDCAMAVMSGAAVNGLPRFADLLCRQQTIESRTAPQVQYCFACF